MPYDEQVSNAANAVAEARADVAQANVVLAQTQSTEPKRRSGKATAYADITPLEPEWLWAGRIPSNEVTIIAGDGGIGKGFLLADLAARVTRGAVMPDGSPSWFEGPGSVLLVTSEDDPNMAMTYRLRAAGADLSRVYDMTEDFTVPESLPALYDAIKDIGDVRLVTIDPLSAVSSIALTSSNVRVRRQIMNPLERLAKDRGVAVAVVHHTVKSGRVAGTKGITDAVRMVLRVSRHDEKIRLIHVEKCNIANDSAGDVAYTVTGSFPEVRVAYLAAPPEADDAPTRAPTTAELVLNCLRGSREPLEARKVADLTGTSYGAVRVALTRLKTAQEVFSPSRGMWWTVQQGEMAEERPTEVIQIR